MERSEVVAASQYKELLVPGSARKKTSPANAGLPGDPDGGTPT